MDFNTPDRIFRPQGWRGLVLVACLLAGGCRGVGQDLRYWWNNHGEVGPNYEPPRAAVAATWNDAESPRIDSTLFADPRWWHAFQDPDLDLLIEELRRQNLSLKTAACRIAEARALSNIAGANRFPQNQAATAGYAHTQNSLNTATALPGFPLTIDDWSVGFDASWEVDLWGRIRRSIRAADAQRQVAIADYDFVLVTLIGDTATLYIQIRSLEERLELARQNVTLQLGSLDVAQKRFQAGRTSKLDVVQARSSVAATRALIPQLELARRQSLNALAVLLGKPPGDVPFLSDEPGQLPVIPEYVITGIPAELLTRRPDIRSAERLLASRLEQIGIAEADLYPTFTVSGSLGYQAAQLSDLFETSSFTGTIAPGFRWNILNYGRLRNGVRVEEARFRQARFDFENTVLVAQGEVEDAIVEFIKSHEQLRFDRENEIANREAVELVNSLYKEGKEDFGRVFVVQSGLVTAQDQLVSTRANIALALIRTYKALGGGWEIRCENPVAVAVDGEPGNGLRSGGGN